MPEKKPSRNRPKRLKSEAVIAWLMEHWAAEQKRDDMLCIATSNDVMHEYALAAFDKTKPLWKGWRFVEVRPATAELVPPSYTYGHMGLARLHTGAMIHRFESLETGETLETMTISATWADNQIPMTVTYVCLPEALLYEWRSFAKECAHLIYEIGKVNHVVVIGGRIDSYVPTVEWDDVVLPAELKATILNDVQSFFTKGIGTYRQLNLKPFRKLLLAGAPGTGKTMLCNALAKWALAKEYLVIYVSSAARGLGDQTGANFGKIDQALGVAADNRRPTMMIIEELDAYLQAGEKALILNVLDGVESAFNPEGTLLVTTTNYPEAIDERILKRPGRLDRIFIIPEVRAEADAEQMLKQYLGAMWQDEHRAIVPKLIGYPGAFIREVSVYALTQVAYDGGDHLSLALLERSFQSLQDQIEARDDFLKQRVATTADANGNSAHT